ncbi:hypothetical protein G7075_12355 [Phycicoccus sp. HDW14]|uniref:hypothetical protein n=1 Tax=Phycicoccus sp. HDW14 TaxID=2714941 RepID=UPI00140DFF25|nr:hypothetical protein [Phycicoccus sp. HDW14]QIM21733.1 hypothetical protein G7075_12355 [Phycicoccus sp. HDW14]
MTAGTRRAVALAVAVGVLLLGGCSALAPPRVPEPTTAATTPPASLPTTAEAFRDARTFALAAESGHLTGTLGSGARAVRIDLEGSASGGNQRLVRTVAGRGTSVVLTVESGHWLAGDADFWRTRVKGAAAVRARVGRWAPVRAAEARSVGPETLRGVLEATLTVPAVTALEVDPAPVTEDEVDGRPAWLLGSEAAGARVWVAAGGGGEVLRVAVSGTGAVDLLTSDWERATAWQAPTPGEVPDLGPAVG